MVAIASCKGGVGKTTIAVNLAMVLRRQGKRVGLFDADLYGPNVPLMLGIRQEKVSFPMVGFRPGKPLMSFIPIARTDARPYIQPTVRFGLRMMSLGLWFGDVNPITEHSRLGAQMVLQTLRDVLWGELDILIIDLPPGTGDFQEELVRDVRLDGIVLVTTPQDMAMMDTSRSLRLFRSSGVAVLGYVENMSYLTCPHCGRRMEVFGLTRQDLNAVLELPSLGKVPLDPSLGRPIDADHPLTQLNLDDPGARIFTDLAGRVMGRLEELECEGTEP